MKGSCLCGAIQYEADQVGAIGHCHCRTCRKANAAAFVSTAWVSREHFRWLKGADQLSSFESSPGRFRSFCSRCGSHLVAERSEQPHIVLRVATLDDDPDVTPSVHIWTSHDVPWLRYEDMRSYAEGPPVRK